MTKKMAEAGRFLAKALGIKLEDSPNFLVETFHSEGSEFSAEHDTFLEESPTTIEFLRDLVPSGKALAAYGKSLFPCISWLPSYNLHWLAGDVVAGITIGAIVVPQGMAYAILANLEPQYGLYSAFVGPVIYWLFATSKDITIGPVAVMSTLVGNVVNEVRLVHPDYPAHVIASALSIIAGCIITAIGLFRCGWIVDLISLTSLSAFMTGSAITIGVGQLPSLMGINSVNSREAPYLVFINTWKHIRESGLDAAMGISALVMLYLIRWVFTSWAHKVPKHQRLLFFLNTLRSVFVILLYTLISWLVNMHRKDHPAFKILGSVPRGFQAVGVPVIDTTLIGAFARFLPASVIVLLVEHIAISKSFGRLNNYVIDPSQEMVAIGVSNVLGPFFGAYPATGSFSRTAIKSKAGVRTPASGVITGAVVLLATYTLTSLFFYIPSASLAAVIIHAVADLVTSPNTVYQFWKVSPLEVLIFFIGVFVSVFSNIENGIYATVCISAAILFFRTLKAKGSFLGKVRVHSVLGDHIIGEDHRKVVGSYGTFGSSDHAVRSVFLPITHDDGHNPQIDIQNPYPGIFIYRFTEGFNYPNASNTLEHFLKHIFSRTRRTTPLSYERLGDRPWNDPGPSRTKRKAQRNGDTFDEEDGMPTLKAIILDFSSVNHVDITSVQRLIDVRNQLDRYTAPETVDWHFACISNRWTKRALVSAGFGCWRGGTEGREHQWRSIFSVAEIGVIKEANGEDDEGGEGEAEEGERGDSGNEKDWSGVSSPSSSRRSSGSGGATAAAAADGAGASAVAEKVGGVTQKIAPPGQGVKRRRHSKTKRKGAIIQGLNRPLFHVDLTNALQSAIANVEARHDIEHSVGVTTSTGS